MSWCFVRLERPEHLAVDGCYAEVTFEFCRQVEGDQQQLALTENTRLFTSNRAARSWIPHLKR